MNQHLKDQPIEKLEARLEKAAGNFPYPATPDIAGSVKRHLALKPTPSRPGRRRLAWTTVAALFIVAILLTVPPVRAAVLEVLRLGAVRIFLIEPSPTPLVPPTATPILTKSAGTAPPTPIRPSPSPPASILDLAGETTLAQAQAQVDFSIRLPGYPPDLGPPDKVFLQDFNGPLIILVWFDPDHPDQVRLSLHQLGPHTFAGKGAPQIIQETTVHGERALWLEGPHLLQLRDKSYELSRLVAGNVLLWLEGEITYRLETDLALDQAVRIAESLQKAEKER